MHYQHRFHAGNFADVFKHVVLCNLLQALNRKDTPWAYLETHAGAGGYAIDAAAERTQEYQDGIGRLYGRGDAPAPVAAYLDQVRAQNTGGLRRYPGSPAFAAQAARAGDRLVLCERQPAIAAELKAALGQDRRVAIHQRDGYEAAALLPLPEKRMLVLADPPFERPDEFDALADFTLRALQRSSSGIYALWYPYKKRFDTERFLRRMRRDLKREALNCLLDTGAPSEGQMHACGMLVINPPFPFVNDIGPALQWLATALAAGPRPRAQAELWSKPSA